MTKRERLCSFCGMAIRVGVGYIPWRDVNGVLHLIHKKCKMVLEGLGGEDNDG